MLLFLFFVMDSSLPLSSHESSAGSFDSNLMAHVIFMFDDEETSSNASFRRYGRDHVEAHDHLIRCYHYKHYI